MNTCTAVLAAALTGVVLACTEAAGPGPGPNNGGNTGNNDNAIQVTTVVKPPAALPGDTLLATVTAVPASGITLDKLFLAATGMLVRSESIATSGTGSQSASWTYVVPFSADSGSIVFRGIARAGALMGTGQTIVPVRDTVPPTFTFAGVGNTKAELGTSLAATALAQDNSVIAAMVVRWSGATSGFDSIKVDNKRTASLFSQIAIPPSAPLGQNLQVTFRVYDVARQSAVRTFDLLTTDTYPPWATGTIGGSSLHVPGDVLFFRVTGHDNAAVRWLGYRIGAPLNLQDSVAVNDTMAVNIFQATIQASWIGSRSLTVFARDAGGNLYENAFAASLTVQDLVRHPYETLYLGAAVTDLAFDEPRNALYISQNALKRIAVVSLASATLGTPIALDDAPSGLDVSAGGDSLLVALFQPGKVAVVDLSAASPAITTVAVNDTFRATGVQVLSNNRALVAVSSWGAGLGGQMWEVNLATGVASRRTDVGYSGNVGESTPMVRSWDRKKLFFLLDGSCCPETGQVYDAPGNAMGSLTGTVNQFYPTLSADSTGSRYLMARDLFDGSLARLRTFTHSDFPPYYSTVSTISPNGEDVYFSTGYGYIRMKASDGSVVEKVTLPFAPLRLMALPGGHTLIATTDQALAIVTLP